MGARARVAWIGVAVWSGSAALATAQAQVWATRYDSGPVAAQDARLGAGDLLRGKHALATDAAGGTYATGTLDKYSDTDCLTVKYDASGAVAWSAVYDGGVADTCYAIARDGAGGVYVTGTTGTVRYDEATGAQSWVSPAAGVAVAADGSGIVVAGDGALRRLDGAGAVQWAQVLPGQARGVVVDAAGNTYVALVESNGLNDDYGTRKFDAAGVLLWSQLFNGSGNAADVVHDIGVDATGAVYVTGSCANASDGDACTVKYDAAGVQQWGAVHDGGNADSGNALVVDAAGGVAVAGSSRTAASDDFLTIKYSTAGAVQWTRLHDPNNNNNDAAYAIGQDAAGDLRVTGFSVQGSGFDFRTVKYTAAGALSWTVAYSVQANRSDFAYALTVDTAGNVIVGGYSQASTGGNMGSEFRLVKYDTAGTQQWTTPHPAVATDPEDRPTARKSMAVDGAGNVYVLGRSFNGQDPDFRLVKHDAAGVVAWTRTYAGSGGNDEPEALALDPAGNVYVTGTTATLGNAGTNFVTIKYDAAGTQLWLVTHNNGPSDRARALAVDASGNAYVTGQYTTGSHFNIRTVKYNASGVQQWAQSAGGTDDDDAAAVAVDASGNVYVTGSWFNGSNHDVRTLKYSAEGALQWNVVHAEPANSTDVPVAIAVNAGGEVFVAGSSQQGASGVDFLTIKYSAAGSPLWTAVHDGGVNGSDAAVDLALDASGSAYVGGTASSPAGADFTVVKYDAAGAQQWAAVGGHAVDGAAADLALDAAGGVYLTGHAATATGLDYRTVKFDGAGVEQWAVGFTGPGTREDRAVAVAVDALANVYVTGSSRDQDGIDFVTIKLSGDATAPTNPTVTSTSHTPSTWTNLAVVAMEWSGASDDAGGSGLAGYSHLFDAAAGTTPDTGVDTPQATDPHTTASGSLPDGASHYFHLRTCDAASNCAVAVHAGPYFIDGTAPDAPASLSSTSHTTSNPSGDRTIDIVWSAASDPLVNGAASGVDGYSVFFDADPSPACDFAKDVEEDVTTATSSTLANGTWYAHVCARDNAGNWSALATAGPYVIEDQADLSIVKTDSADPVNASSDFSYTLAVSNAGPSTADSLTVTDALPAGLTFVSATGTGWTCGETAGTVTCTRATLAVGAAEPITITVTAPAEGGTVTNTASVSTTTADPAAANNSEGETTDVTAIADLSVTKTDGQTVAVPGQSVTYTIVVSSAGPSSVTDATVSDVLPATLENATWTCSASAGSSCAASGAGSISDSVDLPAGGTATYTLAATVSASATGTLANTATVASTVEDPSLANNTATDTDSLAPEADLAVAKTDGQTVVVPGQSLTYTIVVSNGGPSAVTGATVTDTLPAVLENGAWTCSASSGSSCTASGAGNIDDTVDLLASGSATYTLTATVGAGASGALVNTATVGVPATATDPNSANDSAEDADSVVDPLTVETELGHGTRLVTDLASLGVNADEDRYRIHQDPWSSYEVMVDAASGDLGADGAVLERLAADGVTVLQTARPVGVGSARTLRWTNPTATPVADQSIRVRSAGCSSDCGADDTYRIRAWETSGRLARFNNAGSQVTILLLQNPTAETVSGVVYLWNVTGTQVAQASFTLDAHQLLVLNTATLAAGLSGAVTVVHDGPYGGLVGKSVALEPATGFSFDSPIGNRLR